MALLETMEQELQLPAQLNYENIMSKGRLQQGSDEWIRLRFDAMSEAFNIKSVQEKLLQEGRGSDFYQLAERWLESQFGFFLTEFGAGRTLPIQPPYLAEVDKTPDGQIQVYAFSLRDFGDQKKSYVGFDGVHESVREGLLTAYGALAHMNEGEGMFRLSPSEYYTAFGSHYDVIEFYRVVEVRGDGSRLLEGRYLILDRILTPTERMFVVNQTRMNTKDKYFWNTVGDTRLSYSAEHIVKNPQPLLYEDVEDPILHQMWKMSYFFGQAFGRPLVGDTDFAMYEKIFSRVRTNLSKIMQLCMRADVGDHEVVPFLRSLMFSSQRQWAEYRGIDPDEHIRQILEGELIIGFEVGFEFDDPTAKSVFDNLIEKRGYCHLHNQPYNRTCPDCEASRRNWNYIS